MIYLLKGGLIFVPQNHKNATRVKDNSGFYIATNVYPDFGNHTDCKAIRKRLEVFNTKSLQNKDSKVSGQLSFSHSMFIFSLLRRLNVFALNKNTIFFQIPGWLRKNCMQVFNYVANALKDVPLFDSDTDDAIPAEDSGAVYNDFDYSPMELLQTNGNDFCFSQTTNLQKEDKRRKPLLRRCKRLSTMLSWLLMSRLVFSTST